MLLSALLRRVIRVGTLEVIDAGGGRHVFSGAPGPRVAVRLHSRVLHADVTFVLSNGGHNAGIVSPPGAPHREHQIATHRGDENYVDPDAWQQQAEHHDGSWWPCWLGWLERHSGDVAEPPPMGASRKGLKPLCDAPGTYVFER